MTGKPKILSADLAQLQRAGRALRAGQLVAIPTETVYGLGAAIDQEEALQAVFTYKQRPFEDPLIVHVLDARQAEALWQVPAETLKIARVLMKSFWPGPLTLVARSQSHVSRLVRGGGDTVGVRSPQHPIARALIQEAGVPIAAPSANLFGHVSPTRAQHVADDFYDRELLIVDGDDCAIGIESTVVILEDEAQLRLLRHGAISESQIRDALLQEGLQVSISSKQPGQSNRKIEAPGQYLRHYAPRTPAWMLSPLKQLPDGVMPKETLLLSGAACLDFMGRFQGEDQAFRFYFDLSPAGQASFAAHILFQQLRALETQPENQLLLLPELNPHKADEQALYDRIFRACEGKRAYLTQGVLCLC